MFKKSFIRNQEVEECDATKVK